MQIKIDKNKKTKQSEGKQKTYGMLKSRGSELKTNE